MIKCFLLTGLRSIMPKTLPNSYNVLKASIWKPTISLNPLNIWAVVYSSLLKKIYFKTLHKFIQCSFCRHNTLSVIPYFSFHIKYSLIFVDIRPVVQKTKGILGNTMSGNPGCLIQGIVQGMAWNKNKSAAGIEIHSQTYYYEWAELVVQGKPKSKL